MIDFHTPITLVISILFCLFLSILDVTLTIKSVKLFKIVKPNRNPHDMEINPIPVWLWERFGYKKARIIQYFMNSIIILFSLIFTYLYVEQWFFFMFGLLLGSFLIINLIHWGNLDALKKDALDEKRG